MSVTAAVNDRTKPKSLAEIAKAKCDMKDWKLDEPQMAMIDADTYVLRYKGTFDGTCDDGPNGRLRKAEARSVPATVFVRNGDKWQAAFHGENMIIDPKNPPAAEKKAEPAKDEAKKEEQRRRRKRPIRQLRFRHRRRSGETGRDANTDALVKIHT